MLTNLSFLHKLFSKRGGKPSVSSSGIELDPSSPIGIIAGNGALPLRFVERAKANGHHVVAVCHEGETDQEIASKADVVEWIKVGQLGRIIEVFSQHKVNQIVMLGGISRVRSFDDVKLDSKGALMMLKVRSGKDDVIMRGVAQELGYSGINVLPCSTFFEEAVVEQGVLTKSNPSKQEREDIDVGVEALRAMSAQHIGQLVVVRDGVVVAVEAVEGSDQTILRGGELGGAGTVVVKCAKTTQDLRFDLPTVGLKTIENLKIANARVLALEAGKCMLLDRNKFIEEAEQANICVVGICS